MVPPPEALAAVRRTMGHDVMRMVDVQYLWEETETCGSVARDWAEFKAKLLKTPLWPNAIREMTRLRGRTSVPQYGRPASRFPVRRNLPSLPVIAPSSSIGRRSSATGACAASLPGKSSFSSWHGT